MKLNYWIYIEKEISDLTDTFSKVFAVSDFYRDYENAWEWIEGNSDNLKAKVNISRRHNWESGEYDKPLRIQLDFVNDQKKERIEEIGILLSKELKTLIIQGEIKYLKGNDYEYIELNRF